MTFKFAGIGPRDTPDDVLILMAYIGKQLTDLGWIGVSGYASGADQAWLSEMPMTQQEIWLPWWGYNNSSRGDPRMHIAIGANEDRAMHIASDHYNGDWYELKQGAKKLFARNVNILAGADCETAVDMCLYWQSEKRENDRFGGTNHARRIAATAGIPSFNIRTEEGQQALDQFVESKANEPQT